VKYVKFWEVAMEDQDEAIKRWGAYLEKSKKTLEKYPRYILLPHGVGEALKGISILEADTEDQLINYILELAPPLQIKFVPLLDATKYIETYMQTKK